MTTSQTPAFPFTADETNAAIWAIAAAHLLLKRAEAAADPQADELRRKMPGLLAAVPGLKDGYLDAQDAHAVAVALIAACQMHQRVTPDVWAALRPPPIAVLESAREKAFDFPGASSLRG